MCLKNFFQKNETKIIYDEKVKEVDKLLLSNNNIPTTLDNNKELTDSKNELQKTKIVCYRRKDGIFTPTILKSKQQHHKIEIIPEDKEGFSFSDFIIFAISSYPTFITSTPVKSSVPGIYLTLTSIPNIKIDKNIPDYQKSSYSIRVEFDQDFNNIHVYVKNHLNYFTKDENKGLLMFKYKSSQNYDIFDKIIPNHEDGAMLSVFGSYISDRNFKSPIFLKYTFSKFQSKRTQQYKKKNTFIQIISLKCSSQFQGKFYLSIKELVPDVILLNAIKTKNIGHSISS